MKYLKIFLGVLMFAQIGCQEKPKKNSVKVKVPEKKQLKKSSKPNKKKFLIF